MNNECTVNRLFNALAETPGRNDKISLLETTKGNNTVQQVLYYALNPYLQYNIRKIPKYTPNPASDKGIEEFFDTLPKLSERIVTGHAAIDTLRDALESLSPEAALVAEKIIKKDLRCGVQASTVNKVFKELIPTYPCLLGKGYDEKTIQAIQFPAYSQLKADGMRINIIYRKSSNDTGTITVRGRSGKLVDLLGHLDNSFLHLGSCVGRDVVFDGELVVLEEDGSVMPRKKGNGILNKAVKGTISEAEAKRVRVRLWDIITYTEFIKNYDPTPYKERWDELRTLVNYQPHFLYQLIECKEVATIDEATEHFEWAIIMGEEGTMLKNMDHPWEDKRSKHLIKMKSELEIDLEVVEWQEGTGKYKGMMGALICENSDKTIRVSVGSGFTDKERKTIGPEIIGKIVSLRYNERISSKTNGPDSLFLPRYLEERTDKSTPD